MGVDLVHALLQDPVHTRVEPGHANGVEGAGLHPVREFVEMERVERPDAGAPEDRAADRDVFADIGAADACGTHQTLVARECQQVDAHGLDVDGNGARALAGVHRKVDSGLPAATADLADRLDRADDVGGVVHYDEPGVLPEGLLDVVGIDVAPGVERDVCDLDPAVALEVVKGAENRIVLEVRGDDVVALREHAHDDPVEGVGGVVGEGEPVGVGAVEEVREQLPGAVDDVLGLQRPVEARTAGAHPVSLIELLHEIVHDLRLRERCRGIVEVDQIVHPCSFQG